MDIDDNVIGDVPGLAARTYDVRRRRRNVRMLENATGNATTRGRGIKPRATTTGINYWYRLTSGTS